MSKGSGRKESKGLSKIFEWLDAGVKEVSCNDLPATIRKAAERRSVVVEVHKHGKSKGRYTYSVNYKVTK